MYAGRMDCTSLGWLDVIRYLHTFLSLLMFLVSPSHLRSPSIRTLSWFFAFTFTVVSLSFLGAILPVVSAEVVLVVLLFFFLSFSFCNGRA